MKNINVRQTIAQRSPRFRARLMAIAISSCFSSAVYAVGVNPNVVAGSATFNQNGNTMTVTNSNGTIINWGALSVLAGEKMIFDQAANSSVLNRVIGMNVNGKWVVDPTVIAGTISSKGSVWIVNASGIMAKQGAVIDVGRFVASTLNISDANFLAGKFQFDPTPGAGAVTVDSGASIKTATGGSVYLIGSNVTNNGLITTPEGETILAAGQSVSLVDTGTPGVRVEITGADGNATNLGTILAEAGRIGMAGTLVRNSGTLNASSVVKEGGRIFLKASQDAYVDGDGRIVTTGTKGGSVEVLGNRVAVMDNASIDASGTNGGGTVLIGGDYQGKNADIQNSTITYFGQNASIKADATANGNGGKVIVWANDTTRAFGSISARGGIGGGDGGFVETSGHRYLDVTGARVDAGANGGKAGQWLLDPNDVNIVHAMVGGSDAQISGSSPFAPTQSDTSASTLSDYTINQALNGGTNVVVNTSSGNGGNGDITIGSGVAIANTSGGARTLTLNADRNISMTGATISGNASNSLGVAFNAGGGITVSSSTIQNDGTGAINMAAANGSILIDGSNVQTGGSMTWQATGGFIKIQGNSTNSALVQANGQTFTASDSITVWGGSGGNHSAILQSQGNQSLTAHLIGVYGGATTDGTDNNFALIQASGNQSLNLTGAGASLQLQGGGYSMLTTGSNNSAAIRQTASGGSQDIDFDTSGGSITLTGGAGGGNNQAKIDGGYGSQTINATHTSLGPNITLTGGSGGLWDSGNEAGISLDDLSSGTRTVYAGNISIYGGTGVYGGAGFGSGATQRYYLSGNLYMEGGSSTQLDRDNVPGGAVYIGSKYGADIQLNVGGSVTLKGGTGSPVIIGSLFNSANVAITSGAGQNVSISSSGAGVFIGSRQELAPGTNDLFSNNIMMGSSTSIVSGGNVTISGGGDVGLGYVKAALGAGYGASIVAHGSILDDNGSGVLNVEADSITLRSAFGRSVAGVAISADTKATNSLSADVAVACEICTAQYGGISLRNWSTSPSSISLTDRSLSGSVSFFNQASLTTLGAVHATAKNGDLLVSTSGTLDLGAMAPGGVAADSIILAAAGDITGSTSYSAVAVGTLNGPVIAAGLTLAAGGNIRLAGGTVTGSQVNLVAGSSVALTNSSTVQATTGDMNVIAPTVFLDNSTLLAYGNLNLVANNIVAQNQSLLVAGTSGLSALGPVITNPNANVTMTVTGDMVLNDGVTVESGNDTILNLQGAASTLYLNKTSGLRVSKIISDIATQIPATTHLNFLLNAGGGVVIDGVNTTTTTVGGSGFYVLNSSTPAAPGYGLSAVYMTAATAGDAGSVANTTTTTLTKTSTDSNLTDETSSTTTLILKPIASNGTSGGTTGGDEGTFGSEDKKDSKSNGNGSESTDKKEQSNGKSTSKNQCS